MSVYANIGGGSKQLTSLYANINGSSKTISNMYANINGSSKIIFSAEKKYWYKRYNVASWDVKKSSMYDSDFDSYYETDNVWLPSSYDSYYNTSYYLYKNSHRNIVKLLSCCFEKKTSIENDGLLVLDCRLLVFGRLRL